MKSIDPVQGAVKKIHKILPAEHMEFTTFDRACQALSKDLCTIYFGAVEKAFKF